MHLEKQGIQFYSYSKLDLGLLTYVEDHLQTTHYSLLFRVHSLEIEFPVLTSALSNVSVHIQNLSEVSHTRP